MSKIRYIQHAAIDKAKWDSCITNAGNSLVYGYTWWLDHISPGWHALVLNDYDAVMPLTWRKKYGIYYLYQPFCTAMLGVFHKPGIKIKAGDFLDAIPAKFRYWDIDMNEQNVVENKSVTAYTRINQLLNLSDRYDDIQKSYSRLAKRKLSKATENGMILKQSVSPKTIVELYKNEYYQQHRNTQDDYIALINCCEAAMHKGMAETYIATFPDGEAVAFYIVLKDKSFVYSLLGGSTAKGKDAGAFYFLTDAVIKEHCASGKTFRFEGSDIEGIAFFNGLFGAESITYLHLQQNRLPVFLKYLKK
ncbi:MAG: hypothetical protein QM668_20265 [Agriterribacter sp.]